MAAKPYRGKFHIEWYPKSASEEFTHNDMVTILSTAAGTGYLTSVTSTSPKIFGLIQKAVASTDTDYASATKVPVLVGDTDAEFLVDVASGGAQTEVGQFIDAASDLLLDAGTAYTYGVAEVTEVISSTQLVVKFCKKSGPAITTA